MTDAKKHVDSMETAELRYYELLTTMRSHGEKLVRVHLFRERGSKGGIHAYITCYLENKGGKVFEHKISCFDDDYLWILNKINIDFPDVPFEEESSDDLKGAANGKEDS